MDPVLDAMRAEADKRLQAGTLMPPPGGTFDDPLGAAISAGSEAELHEPLSPAAHDWGHGYQLLDSLLLGHGPEFLAHSQSYGEAGLTGKTTRQSPDFMSDVLPSLAGTADKKVPEAAAAAAARASSPDLDKKYNELLTRYRAAREAWQRDRPGATMVSDLTAGALPALAAIGATEGVAAPVAAARVPVVSALVRGLTGTGRGLSEIPSQVAQGTWQGALAGQLSPPGRTGSSDTNARIGAAEGAAVNPLLRQAGAAAASLGHMPGWMKGSGLAGAGLGALVGFGHELLPELIQFVRDPVHVAAGIGALGAGRAALRTTGQLANKLPGGPRSLTTLAIPAATQLKIGENYVQQDRTPVFSGR